METRSDSFGERLDNAIRVKYPTVTAFARETGISYNTIKQWIQEKRYPRCDQLVYLSSCLDISIDWLLMGKV